MELIKSPWADAFDKFAGSVRNRALLASPFIGAGPLDRLASLISPSGRPSIEILTNLDVDSLLSGSVNTEAIAGFCRKLPSTIVRHLPGLHAKTYVADDEVAIITSGNLTQASLTRNLEYGVKITDRALVRQIWDDLHEYGTLGIEVSPVELDGLTEISRSLQWKHAEALRGVRATARTQFDEQLGKARDTLLELRARPGESTNSIFSRTLLYILKRGPLSTQDIHPMIEGLHPDLCDNFVDRVINGVRFGRRWKHMVRNAQQSLRSRGLIDFRQRRWRLME